MLKDGGVVGFISERGLGCSRRVARLLTSKTRQVQSSKMVFTTRGAVEEGREIVPGHDSIGVANLVAGRGSRLETEKSRQKVQPAIIFRSFPAFKLILCLRAPQKTESAGWAISHAGWQCCPVGRGRLTHAVKGNRSGGIGQSQDSQKAAQIRFAGGHAGGQHLPISASGS